MDEIEQVLDEAKLDDVLATSYVQPGEIQVRLTIRDAQCRPKQKKLAAAEQAIFKRVGRYCFGIGEHVTLAEQVVKLLREHQWTITGAGKRWRQVSVQSAAFQAHRKSLMVGL